jgi:hypothetical protein
MMTTGNDYPVVLSQDGIKLRTEKMQTDQLYHCIYDNKVFLFYKDEDSLLHCYEVEDSDAVKEIVANPSEIESVLKKYAKALDKKELD